MNKANTIAENCRSILRERCGIQQSYNHPSGFDTFPQQECPPEKRKPCHVIPTNPIYSLYGVDNLRVSDVCRERPFYCNTSFGHPLPIPTNNFVCQPSFINRNTAPMQTNHGPCVSTPSENCLDMIANAIITKIRYKVPHKEIALLCCCLPSLIRQIMCKSPWLTPYDIIQCLSEDIIKEAMVNLYQTDFDGKNKIHKSKRDHNSKERLVQKQNDEKSDDTISIKSSENDSDSLLSYQSISSETSQESLSSESDLSQLSSRSVLDSPSKHRKKKKKIKVRKEQRKTKKNKTRTPSTRSFSSQKSNDRRSNNHTPATLSPWDSENKYKKTDRDSPVHVEEKQKSISSRNKDSYLSPDSVDSNEKFDEKSIEIIPKQEFEKQSPRNRIEYPGKKDPNAIQDVEKCLAFYHQIREYFDDDVAAMLLKCCLCYGGCSGKT